MNKVMTTITITIFLLSSGFSQNNMNFKFGLPISSAQFLLKERTIIGKSFTPTISCGYFSLSATDKETINGTTKTENMGAHLFIPRVGIRFMPKLPTEPTDLRRYYYTDAFTILPIFTGDQADDLKEEWDNQINLYGLIAGSGIEYFFSKEFSLGGEISMNLLVNSWSDEHEEWSEDYWDSGEVIVKDELSLRAGAIFTQFTFNYYFK